MTNKRTEQIRVILSEAEKDPIVAAAKRNDRHPGEWARIVLKDAAEKDAEVARMLEQARASQNVSAPHVPIQWEKGNE